MVMYEEVEKLKERLLEIITEEETEFLSEIADEFREFNRVYLIHPKGLENLDSIIKKYLHLHNSTEGTVDYFKVSLGCKLDLLINEIFKRDSRSVLSEILSIIEANIKKVDSVYLSEAKKVKENILENTLYLVLLIEQL